MLLLREFYNGKTNLDEIPERLRNIVEDIINLFSDGILKEVYSGSVAREKAQILKANYLLVSNIKGTHREEVYSFIFCNSDSDSGFLYGASLNTNYNLIQQMTEVEKSAGEVIFGFTLEPNEMGVMDIDKIQTKVVQYLDTIR